MKPICCNSYTLEDNIVIDGIRAIEEIKKENKILAHIAGGMGVQSYIPEKFHRKTIDLDFTMLWGGCTEDFKQVTAPLKSFLENEGYSVDLKRKNLTFDYNISKENNSFIIQHKRESENHFQHILKNSLEREMYNHRKISRGELTYDVLSPEDLVTHKLFRVNIFINRYGIKKPVFESLEKSYSILKDFRTELISHFDDASPEQIAELRILCDLFDVKCLGDYAGLNKDYFNEVTKEYSSQDFIKQNDFYKDIENLQIQIN